MADAESVDSVEFFADTKVRLARAFVSTYGPDRGEEALAEAMAYAWAHRDRLASMTNPVGYLYRVGQSRTRDQKRPVSFPTPDAVGMPDVEPELVKAVASLPERQRVCTLLVLAYEWSQVEVADLLGISPSSVHRHVQRGLGALRRKIGTLNG